MTARDTAGRPENAHATTTPPTPRGSTYADRAAAIVRLLSALHDGLPDVSRVESHAASGFAHRVLARVQCEDCLANDRPAGMPGCVSCGGRGYVEQRRFRDPYARESDAKPRPYGLTHDRHESARALDAEIARLEGQIAHPRPEADMLAETRPYGWEVARRRLYASYDLAACERVLERLRHVDPDAHHALCGVHVYGWLERTTPRVEEALERGLELLDRLLPMPLRVPVAPGERPRSRDAEIVAAVLDRGVPERQVAARVGLSVRQVQRIVSAAVAERLAESDAA